jgi:hypothetical protein
MRVGKRATTFQMIGGANGQKSEATAPETLDQGPSEGAKEIFEGQDAGKENLKADEPFGWLTAAKSQGITHQARPSSLRHPKPANTLDDPIQE